MAQHRLPLTLVKRAGSDGSAGQRSEVLWERDNERQRGVIGTAWPGSWGRKFESVGIRYKKTI